MVTCFYYVTQRRGRAGRVQPGFCYRLYPKVIHDAMPPFQLPEILRTPLQELCLTIKSLQLGAVASFLAKALQPPDPLSVKNAIELLKTIGALDDMEELTSLGMEFWCYLPFLYVCFAYSTLILCRTTSLYASTGPKYWENAAYGICIPVLGSSIDNCRCSCISKSICATNR